MFQKRALFIIACLAILFFGMAITTLGSVLPQLSARFQLDEMDAGTLFSILPFGLLTGSLLFGPVSDRYGYKAALTVALLLMFAGFEGIAFSHSRLFLNISVFLFGMGGGAINGGTSALVSDISENKGADLSILGVFFSAGALGMPFLLGILENTFHYITIVAAVGLLTCALAIICLFLRFPPAKISGALPVAAAFQMLRKKSLILIACFLFFQSALEGIINNWTPTLLMSHLHIEKKYALYALSLSVAGMAVMRILLGTAFRQAALARILLVTFILLPGGYVILFFSGGFFSAVAGLICIGAGLAAGFPMMLGIVGELFKELSATAFSVVFVIALFGNILINYLLGIFVNNYGSVQIITFGFSCSIVMAIFCVFIVRKTRAR